MKKTGIIIFLLILCWAGPLRAQTIISNYTIELLRAIPLNSTTIRWEFNTDFDIDDSLTIRLADTRGNVIKNSGYKVAKDLKYFDETGLKDNTTYWRSLSVLKDNKPVAFSEISVATTMISSPRMPAVVSLGRGKIIVSIGGDHDWDLDTFEKISNGSLSYGGVGFDSDNLLVRAAVMPSGDELVNSSEAKKLNETAFLFENITTSQKSDWVSAGFFTFSNLDYNTEYEFRYKSRNAEGIETEFGPSLKVKSLPKKSALIQLQVVPSLITGDIGAKNEDFNFDYVRANWVFLPGDQVKYTVYYRNIGHFAADNVFLLAKVPQGFKGGMKLNGKTVSEQKDEDSGDYSMTLDKIVFFDLKRLPPGKGGVVEFVVEIAPKTALPSVMRMDVLLGYKNAPVFVRSFCHYWIGAINLVGDGDSLGLDALGGLNNDFPAPALIFRQNNMIGGGNSRPDFTVADVSLGAAYQKISGRKEYVLDQDVFVSTTPQSEDEKSKTRNNPVFTGPTEEMEENFSKEMADFLRGGGAQDVLPELKISGEIQKRENKLFIKGDVGEKNVEIYVWINDELVGKTVSIVGGVWTFSVDYKSLVNNKSDEHLYVDIQAQGQRFPRFAGDLPEKSKMFLIGSEDIDFSKMNLFPKKDKAVYSPIIVDKRTGEGLQVSANGWRYEMFKIRPLLIIADWGLLVIGLCVLLLIFLSLRGISLLRILYLFRNFWCSDKKVWGQISDSVSHRPIKRALVNLYKLSLGNNGVWTPKLYQSTFSDFEGRYGFKVIAGDFYLSVSKIGFVFPSVPVIDGQTQKSDLIYHGQRLIIKSKDTEVKLNILIDRV